MHYGQPSDKQREAYTRVLMGVIDLALMRFPPTAYGKYALFRFRFAKPTHTMSYTGRDFDGAARRALWEVGWDYRHGTGHGIGMFLNVHEGDCVGIAFP